MVDHICTALGLRSINIHMIALECVQRGLYTLSN
jgi:hypothetical protein